MGVFLDFKKKLCWFIQQMPQKVTVIILQQQEKMLVIIKLAKAV